MNPVSPYGASKLEGEIAGVAYAASFGLPFRALRFFNVYGPRQRQNVFYDLFTKLLKDSGHLSVLGDAKQVRDPCYIDDLIEAFSLVAERAEDLIYNVGSGIPITVRDIASAIVNMVAPGAEIRYGAPRWRGDVDVLISDISRIKSLGYIPQIDFSEGIRRFIDWQIERTKALRHESS